MHGIAPMRKSRLRIRRRRDGVIEVRRRRLRDDVFFSDAAVLLALLFGCSLFIVALTAVLVTSPVLIAATAAFLLPGVCGSLLARSAARIGRSPSPAPIPPPRRSA